MQSIVKYIQPSLAFYERVNDAVLITDLEGKIVYVNTTALVLLDGDKKNILKKKCNQFFQSPNTFSDFVLELGIKKRILRSVECLTNSGKIFKSIICASPIYIEQTIPAGVLLILRHPKKVNSNELYFAEHSSILHALNFHSDEMIIVSDVINKENIFCSRAVETLFGWKPKDFISGGWAFVMSLTHPDDINLILESYTKEMKLRNDEKFIHDHKPIVFEYRKKHHDGSWRWVHVQIFVLERNDKEEVHFTVAFIRDITNEKIKTSGLSNKQLRELLSQNLNNLPEQRPPLMAELILSEREKQILQLVKNGLSTKAMASQLGITINSVNTYRKKLMQKLHAKNTAELVRISYELKIL